MSVVLLLSTHGEISGKGFNINKLQNDCKNFQNILIQALDFLLDFTKSVKRILFPFSLKPQTKKIIKNVKNFE